MVKKNRGQQSASRIYTSLCIKGTHLRGNTIGRDQGATKCISDVQQIVYYGYTSIRLYHEERLGEKFIIDLQQ